MQALDLEPNTKLPTVQTKFMQSLIAPAPMPKPMEEVSGLSWCQVETHGPQGRTDIYSVQCHFQPGAVALDQRYDT